jgi:membrane associated rhomboid family serine protease
MNAPPSMTMAFPKPGRALWAVMVTMAVMGIVMAGLATWVPGGGEPYYWLVCLTEKVLHQPWRLLTSGLLTDRTQWSHLLFSLVGLYFLGAPLEARWGSWRFVRFLLLGVLFGNLAMLAVGAVAPAEAQGGRFAPMVAYGPWAAITAVTVAWSREYADSTVNIFFFVPVRGRTLFWVTLGFCVLDLVYPVGLPEGVIAPFGGIVAGLIFGGSPSLARTAWLHLRLALLRRQHTSLRVSDVVGPRPERRQRSGGPPLRVVSGGLDEVLKKRQPPKDKRYLN